jgi:hypothetical protein
MSNQGGFSEEAFEKYQRLLSEQENVEFSEGETYDFTRCMRPDGTFYGTRGKCKKGSEAGAAPVKAKSAKPATRDEKVGALREKVAALKGSGDKKKLAEARGDLQGQERMRKIEAQAKKEGKPVDQVIRERNESADKKIKERIRAEYPNMFGPGRRDKELDRQVVGGQKAAAAAKAKLAAEPKKPEAARPSKEELDRRVEAMIKEENRRKGGQSAEKPKRKLATSQETRAAWQEAEKAVKDAKAEYARVKAETKGDKSREANKKLIAAGTALDKAERMALKASDKFGAAAKRESKAAMTPEQRKQERDWNKFKKQYG